MTKWVADKNANPAIVHNLTVNGKAVAWINFAGIHKGCRYWRPVMAQGGGRFLIAKRPICGLAAAKIFVEERLR